MINKHALTSQMVMHCICSTTSTILDPNFLSAMLSASRGVGSFGSMRLLLVFDTMFMPTINTVSVIYTSARVSRRDLRRDSSFRMHRRGGKDQTNHGEDHEGIVNLQFPPRAQQDAPGGPWGGMSVTVGQAAPGAKHTSSQSPRAMSGYTTPKTRPRGRDRP